MPITQFAPEVPEALEWIIAEALTKIGRALSDGERNARQVETIEAAAEAGALPTSPSEFNRSIPPQSVNRARDESVSTRRGNTGRNARSTTPSGELAVTQAILKRNS
jgi:hypothetical protein